MGPGLEQSVPDTPSGLQLAQCLISRSAPPCACDHLCPTLCSPLDCSPSAPLSMGFPRQEYCSGLPFPSPRDLSGPRIKHLSPVSPVLQVDFLPIEPLRKPLFPPNVHSNTQKSKNWKGMASAPGNSGFSTHDSRLAEAFLTWTAPQKGS